MNSLGLVEANPSKRSLGIIAKRVDIPTQYFQIEDEPLQSITAVPEFSDNVEETSKNNSTSNGEINSEQENSIIQ